jgi:hypothetical protein
MTQSVPSMNWHSLTHRLELSRIPEEKAKEVRGRSVIPFEDRIRELTAFQAFMKQVNTLSDTRPIRVRAEKTVGSRR